MSTRTRCSIAAVMLALAVSVAGRADAPHVYAIKGARLMTAAGPPIASGTIVLRNGLIEAVGADVDVPADAIAIEGVGLTAYPGLIDMGHQAGLDVGSNQSQPTNLRTTEEAERWKRGLIFRPELEAASHLKETPELARLAARGITTVLATPPGVVFKGRSALVNVATPPDEPQIGGVGDYRQGVQVVRAPVALHVEFPSGVRGDAYPVSLLGVIAFVRQSFLDAQHHQATKQPGIPAARSVRSAVQPGYDPSLDALQPALDGKLPVAFEADLSREILRALNMAREFKLDAVITGGREADQVAADLKARQARVIYSLNYPVRSRALPPDADEPISDMRARARAPQVPAALAKAGIMFAFSSDGLREPNEFVQNAARAVKDGLSPDAALRALTIDAAKIAGVSDRLGSLEAGKMANVVVTSGDLFEEKTRVTHVFVDGRMVTIEDGQTPRRLGMGGRPDRLR
jgi:imidazolonepropionase-like amidohydrolase